MENKRLNYFRSFVRDDVSLEAYFAIVPRLINAEAKKPVVYIYIYKYHLATSVTDIFASSSLGYMILI